MGSREVIGMESQLNHGIFLHAWKELRMSLTPKDILDITQAVATIVTPITILLTIRQLRLGRMQMKQQSDSATVNFVLGAEGQLDGIHEQMLQVSPDAIRATFGPEIDPQWTDDQLKAFVYYRRLYEHVARMIYIVHDKTIDIGMDDGDRQTYSGIWERTLQKFDANPVMRRVHENALKFNDFNSFMLGISRKSLAVPDGQNEKVPRTEGVSNPARLPAS